MVVEFFEVVVRGFRSFHVLVTTFQGHKYGRRKPKETSVFEFSYLCVNSSLEEFIKIKAVFTLRQGIFT